MARRRTVVDNRAETTKQVAEITPPAALRVAMTAGGDANHERFAEALSARGIEIVPIKADDESLPLLGDAGVDLILCLVSEDAGSFDIIERVASLHRGITCVAMCENPTVDLAVRAMTVGAADLVSLSLSSDELIARLGHAANRGKESRRMSREHARRTERLRRFASSLVKERRELLSQVTDLCASLTAAHEEMAAGVQQVALASEFNSIIRQDLDVESLLRTVLEYLLPRTGPTNAAVFLPASSGDFSLGAYVNYDCPKDTAEVLLDHLACSLAPAFEDETDIAVLGSEHELTSRLGSDAHWLEDSSLVVFTCRQQDECLAVVALFRDRRTPFGAALMPMLRTVRDLFARQLGRIVHTHHRHLPKHKWGSLGDAGEWPGDIDLAA